MFFSWSRAQDDHNEYGAIDDDCEYDDAHHYDHADDNDHDNHD